MEKGRELNMDQSTKMQFEGKWQNVRGRVKEAWGDLTDDELDQTEGKWDQVVGTVKRKTGQASDAIETRLKNLLD
ncbi:MAG: CsbD family protein [Actinomycetota bacterium]